MERGALVQVIAQEEGRILIDAEIPATELWGITTRSACVATRNTSHQTFGGEYRKTDSNDRQMHEKDFVIDKIVNHSFENESHLFLVSWYGYAPKDEISETIEHLPRSHVVQYFQRVN